MVRESIALDDVLEIFVAGGIFVIGSWYLNRSFLLEYFPVIAADFTSGEPKIGGKLALFVIVTLFSGFSISHAFDAVLPLMLSVPEYRAKRYKRLKTFIFLLFRGVSWGVERDPRIESINRYLESSRRQWFLDMVDSWAKADENTLQSDIEKVKIHQHIVARLRAHSPESQVAVKEAYGLMSFSGSLFVALLLLLFVSILSILMNMAVTKYPTYSLSQHIVFITIIYTITVAACYSFRRRMRTFFSQILTIALHFYDAAEGGKKLRT